VRSTLQKSKWKQIKKCISVDEKYGVFGRFCPFLVQASFSPAMPARALNWQATYTDCVPLAYVDQQTVLEPFTWASCNATMARLSRYF